MKDALRPPVLVDLDPQGSPPRLSRLRRTINVIVGGALLGAGLYAFSSPHFSAFTLGVGGMMIFGGLVLAVSAIFPRLTLEKVDRNRWR